MSIKTYGEYPSPLEDKLVKSFDIEGCVGIVGTAGDPTMLMTSVLLDVVKNSHSKEDPMSELSTILTLIKAIVLNVKDCHSRRKKRVICNHLRAVIFICAQGYSDLSRYNCFSKRKQIIFAMLSDLFFDVLEKYFPLPSSEKTR